MIPLRDTLPDETQYGHKVLDWEAHDSHPHQRGRWWTFIFGCVLLLSMAAVFFGTEYEEGSSFFTNSWFANGLMMGTLLFALWVYASLYEKNDTHLVTLYDRALIIDRTILPLSQIQGYWILHDESVSLLHVVLAPKPFQKAKTIILQMGNESPLFFKQGFETVGISELKDQQESVLNQWIRILKL